MTVRETTEQPTSLMTKSREAGSRAAVAPVTYARYGSFQGRVLCSFGRSAFLELESCIRVPECLREAQGLISQKFSHKREGSSRVVKTEIRPLPSITRPSKVTSTTNSRLLLNRPSRSFFIMRASTESFWMNWHVMFENSQNETPSVWYSD